jgi:hypothetical protein
MIPASAMNAELFVPSAFPGRYAYRSTAIRVGRSSLYACAIGRDLSISLDEFFHREVVGFPPTSSCSSQFSLTLDASSNLLIEARV